MRENDGDTIAVGINDEFQCVITGLVTVDRRAGDRNLGNGGAMETSEATTDPQWHTKNFMER